MNRRVFAPVVGIAAIALCVALVWEQRVAEATTPSVEVVTLPVRTTGNIGYNGSVHLQDQFVTAGSTQFGIVIDDAQRPIAMARGIGGTSWQTSNVAAAGLAVTRTDATPPTPGSLLSSQAADTHTGWVAGVDPDGCLHVAGNMHSAQITELRIAKTCGTSNLQSATWSKESMVDAGLLGMPVPNDPTTTAAPVFYGGRRGQVAYPQFVRVPAHGEFPASLVFLFRVGSTKNANWYFTRLTASGWTAPSMILQGAPAAAATSSSASPYLHSVVAGRDGHLHLAFEWRIATVLGGSCPGTPGPDQICEGGVLYEWTGENHVDLSYVRSDDLGATWQAASGTTISLPISRTPAAPKVPLSGGGNVAWKLSNAGGLGVDGSGRPHIVYLRRAQQGVGSAVLHQAVLSGTTWTATAVLTQGSPTSIVNRPIVASTASGSVWLVYRRADRPDELRIGDLASSSSPTEVIAGRIATEDSEFTVDTEAAWRATDPTLDVVATVEGPVSIPPLPSFASQWAGIIRVDLLRVSELSSPGATVPAVAVVATSTSSSGPGAVAIGQAVLQASPPAGSGDLFVRAQARGRDATLTVAANQPSGTTSVGEMKFPASSTTRWTPWIPVGLALTSATLTASVAGTIDSAMLQLGRLSTSPTQVAGEVVASTSVATYEQLGNGDRVVQLLGPAPVAATGRNLRVTINLVDVGSQSPNPGSIRLYRELDGGGQEVLWSAVVPRFFEGSLGTATIDTGPFGYNADFTPTTGRFYIESTNDTALDVFVATATLELQ